ncbi:ribokinase-like isoform X2 [Chenopodium quinoa]|uniref:Carbohydrate kinase PfkB domain-containing protein n=1 Tax=Chenopodium quinoa TaxID=63459 RepID=A0A803LAE3_CHEQI|nr:ribokinase-like isoform X2 [Chenopodium quinoa]
MLTYFTNSVPNTSLRIPHFLSPQAPTSNPRAKMMSSSLPENRIVLGCGGVVVDLLAAVASYPKPDDKIRSTSFQVQGGGNAGNALTCAARLGLHTRLISKVADDAQGRGILEELEADGVDTSFFVVSPEGNSPFTYIIVDNETKTRTCIHTPGYPPLVPEELSRSKLESAIDGAGLVYFDVRLHETALVVAKEVWTEASSVPTALLSMLLKLPKVKFVIVTLGEDGCIMLERSHNKASNSEEMCIDEVFESLKQKAPNDDSKPTCVSSSVVTLKADGIGTLCGRLHVGTAEKIPPSELVDTTGAGDAFIGAVLYASCVKLPPERMLPFASQVAACSCRALGARSGLPRHSDTRLAPFLHEGSEIAGLVP